MKTQYAQYTQAVRELLTSQPLISAPAAIGQIAAMLALDWQTAETLYISVVGE